METVGVAQDESLETLTVCQRARHATERGDLARPPRCWRRIWPGCPRRCAPKTSSRSYVIAWATRHAHWRFRARCCPPTRTTFRRAATRPSSSAWGRRAEHASTGGAGRAAAARPEEPDELASISLLQLEFGRYAAAQETLQRLWQYMPYDENVIHRMGYCRYLQGDVEGAQSCYRRLLRIDPDDTVARYYLNACRKYDAKAHARHWQLPYRVPLGETFRRFQQITRCWTNRRRKSSAVGARTAPRATCCFGR